MLKNVKNADTISIMTALKYRFFNFAIAPIAVAVFIVSPLIASATDSEADPGTAPTSPTPVTVDSTTAYGNTDVPKIYPRGVWENSQDLKNLLTWLPADPNTPPDYAKVERVVVHDQGCLNPQLCTQNATNYPISTIQGIYRFHSVTKGWGDIGYNFIIDRQGRIYEGRYGGNGVRGAHLYHSALCENFNVGTAGILLLGDLRAGPMSSPQSTSLARLAAWIGATNGFDPAALSVTTKVWKNPRSTSGSCDLSQGDFSGSFTGPVLLSHGDIEAGNSDFFALGQQQQAANPLYTGFLSMVWQAEGTTQPYSIHDGVLTPATNSTLTAITIFKTQLEFFPQSTFATLPDGSLVKSAARERVYRIEAGKRRAIPTGDLFNALGYQWTAIQTVSDRQLALWTLGDPMPYPQGTLVKAAAPDIFMFDAGKLRHITSAALFNILHFSWSAIKTINKLDLAGYDESTPMKFPSGTLIHGTLPTVYLLDGELKRPIASAVLFLARGYKWGSIQNLSPDEVALYETGPFLGWPDGSLLKAPDGKVYWIQKGYRRWVETAAAFKAAGFSWTAVKNVSAPEIAAHAEAQGILSKADLAAVPQPIAPPPPPPTPVPPPPPPTNYGPVPPPISSTEPIMRIGLSEVTPGANVQVSFDGAYDVLKNGVVTTSKNSQEITTITPLAGETWRFVPQNAASIATVPSYSDLAWNGTNDNRFRGSIEVTTSQGTGKIWLVNELKIEDYLKGVAESINGEPPEYSKAFAEITRSYAYYYVLKGGKRVGEPYTLVRTPSDQLYKGYNFELRAKDPVAAVIATRGQIAAWNNKPILAAYSSGAPGPTLSACQGLSSAFCNNPDFPYLVGGVADPDGTVYKYTSCGGAVHCVGLDAAGARRMAALGSLAEAILKTYYPGVVVQNAW